MVSEASISSRVLLEKEGAEESESGDCFQEAEGSCSSPVQPERRVACEFNNLGRSDGSRPGLERDQVARDHFRAVAVKLVPGVRLSGQGNDALILAGRDGEGLTFSDARQNSRTDETIRSARLLCFCSPRRSSSAPRQITSGRAATHGSASSRGVDENDLGDDVIANKSIVESETTTVEIVYHGISLMKVILDQVPVIDNLAVLPRLPPASVLDVQPPRPVLDFDEMDRLRGADDQVDLAPSPLAWARNPPAGEEVAALERRGGKPPRFIDSRPSGSATRRSLAALASAGPRCGRS